MQHQREHVPALQVLSGIVSSILEESAPTLVYRLDPHDCYDGDEEYVLVMGHAEALVRRTSDGDCQFLLAGVDWVPLSEAAIVGCLYRDAAQLLHGES